MEFAGLKLLEIGDVSAPFRFANPDTMLRIVGSVGPKQSARQPVGNEVLETAILQAAKPYQNDSDEIVLNNRLGYVTAIA